MIFAGAHLILSALPPPLASMTLLTMTTVLGYRKLRGLSSKKCEKKVRETKGRVPEAGRGTPRRSKRRERSPDTTQDHRKVRKKRLC